MDVIVNIGVFAAGAVAGFVFGMFFFRNNSKKMTDLVDSVNQIKDQLKNIKK